MMLWRRRPWRLGWRRARFPGGGDGTMLGEGLPMVFQRGNLGRRCDDVRAQGQRQRWRTKISSIGSGRLRAQGPRSTPFYAARTRHLRPVPPCASSRTQDGPARAIAELVKKRTGVAREDVAAPFPISPSPDGSYSKLLFVDGEQGPHKQCGLWPPIATALSPRVLLLSPCKVLARFRDNGIQSSLESLELNHTNGTVALLQIVSTAPPGFSIAHDIEIIYFITFMVLRGDIFKVSTFDYSMTEVVKRYMAYIMDTNEEERLKGHKCYIPNMIASASQADIGVLVISARKGEFEAGYESGGQTREHVLLAKTLGVAKLIVVINKMDEPTVQWSKERLTDLRGRPADELQGQSRRGEEAAMMRLGRRRARAVSGRWRRQHACWAREGLAMVVQHVKASTRSREASTMEDDESLRPRCKDLRPALNRPASRGLALPLEEGVGGGEHEAVGAAGEVVVGDGAGERHTDGSVWPGRSVSVGTSKEDHSVGLAASIALMLLAWH
ncbi:hypothetical protein QYE76_000275 [Lolium multiflorum]|uniref:Tr-type G domain-containing protein n=1 Tax=Lolium multiflorum TaxID=4521 RepID=A0AAD8RJR5_LOLMU|nr:hypothetical protein QYE76_000275 [Lolium multiflorum]